MTSDFFSLPRNAPEVFLSASIHPWGGPSCKSRKCRRIRLGAPVCLFGEAKNDYDRGGRILHRLNFIASLWKKVLVLWAISGRGITRRPGNVKSKESTWIVSITREQSVGKRFFQTCTTSRGAFFPQHLCQERSPYDDKLISMNRKDAKEKECLENGNRPVSKRFLSVLKGKNASCTGFEIASEHSIGVVFILSRKWRLFIINQLPQSFSISKHSVHTCLAIHPISKGQPKVAILSLTLLRKYASLPNEVSGQSDTRSFRFSTQCGSLEPNPASVYFRTKGWKLEINFLPPFPDLPPHFFAFLTMGQMEHTLSTCYRLHSRQPWKKLSKMIWRAWLEWNLDIFQSKNRAKKTFFSSKYFVRMLDEISAA